MLELPVTAASRLQLIPAVLLDDVNRLPDLGSHFAILKHAGSPRVTHEPEPTKCDRLAQFFKMTFHSL